MKQVIVSAVMLLGMLLFGLAGVSADAQVRFDPNAYAALTSAGSNDRIPEGTRITLQNWHQYQRFMPVGMQAMFSGTYFFKIGSQPEYSIDVGPTIHIPLSKKYQSDTEQYSNQVRLRKVETGGYTIDNYMAGVPFPNPTGPETGTKVMYDVWFPYNPFVVQARALILLVDSSFRIYKSLQETVIYRLNHLSFN
jgi:Protein of unknown function (DUF1329)